MNILKRSLERLKWLINPRTVTAVHADDLEALSNQLLVTTSDMGTMPTCPSCHQSIDKENLGGWIKTEDGFIPFCNSPQCFPVSSAKDESA
jgi:hypothetical protein